jgi:hypothetical protein|tara:strand:+ start:1184 stop:1399 length:216 start_codon:yes stop_codon:yes gene_type:complete
MKKYKVYFSVFNLFGNTQSEIVKLQQYAKGIVSAIAGMTWYESNATYAIYVGIGGVVLDTLLACLYLEEKN